jgi:hypothetical protein
MNALVAQAEGLCDLAHRSACHLEATYGPVELGARNLGVTLSVNHAGRCGSRLPQQAGVKRHLSSVPRQIAHVHTALDVDARAVRPARQPGTSSARNDRGQVAQ